MHDFTEQRLEELSAHGKALEDKLSDIRYGELIGRLTRHITALTHKEAELIGNDFQETVTSEILMTRRLVIGAALLTLGGASFIVAFVMLLSTWVPAWLSALLLGLTFFGLGGALILAAWRHHVTLAEVEKNLKESLQWSTKVAK